MRFLVDQALSPIVSDELNEAGHDATHTRDYGMQWSEDEEIFQLAGREHRILISSGADFARVCLSLHEPGPSVILLARSTSLSPQSQVALLLGHLGQIRKALEHGSFVVIEPYRIRVWTLPLAMKCQPV